MLTQQSRFLSSSTVLRLRCRSSSERPLFDWPTNDRTPDMGSGFMLLPTYISIVKTSCQRLAVPCQTQAGSVSQATFMARIGRESPCRNDSLSHSLSTPHVQPATANKWGFSFLPGIGQKVVSITCELSMITTHPTVIRANPVRISQWRLVGIYQFLIWSHRHNEAAHMYFYHT